MAAIPKETPHEVIKDLVGDRTASALAVSESL